MALHTYWQTRCPFYNPPAPLLLLVDHNALDFDFAVLILSNAHANQMYQVKDLSLIFKLMNFKFSSNWL